MKYSGVYIDTCVGLRETLEGYCVNKCSLAYSNRQYGQLVTALLAKMLT